MAVNVEILSTDISQLTNGLDEVVKNGKRAKQEFEDLGRTIDNNLAESVKSFSGFEKELKEVAQDFNVIKRRAIDVQDEIKQLTNLQRSLNQEQKKLGEGTKEYAQLEAKIRATQQRIKDLNSETKNLNVETSKTPGILSKIGPGIIAAFSITAILAAIKAVFNFQQELEKTRRLVRQLTDASGAALNRLTASIKATADTFGKDFNEVLIASNTLSREFGITQEEAIQKIQQGFSIGADASGEFLDILREYPAQFKAAGLSADQAIALINQSVEQGIFSDKGPDVIKEATLRLRELPQATRDALAGIGISANEVEKSLRDGTQTIFDVIQQVSGRLGQLPEQSAAVGTAIADIFGGPGEDAGLRYIKLLADVDSSLEDTIKKSDEFSATQLKLVEANEDLELAFNRLFGSADGVFDNIQAEAKSLLAQGINAVIDGVIKTINFFRELYNESLIFRAGIQLIGLQVKNTFDLITLGFNLVIGQFKTVGRIIAARLRGDFDQIGDIIKQSFNDAKNDVITSGREIAGNFIDGFKNVVDPQKLELISLDEEAVQAGKTGGEKAAKSFKEAFAKGFVGVRINEIQGIGINIVDSILGDIDIDETSKGITADINKAIEKSRQDLEDQKEQLPKNFLFRVLGINIDDEDFNDLALAVNEVSNAIANAANERIEASQKELDAIEENIQQTRDALDEQLLLQEEGKANSVDLEKEKLTELNAARAEALSDQQRAVSVQQTLDTIQQAGSIATASANILKGFSTIPIVGPALGIAAVAGMIFSFIQSKVRARQAASFFKGGEYSDLGGYTGNISPYSESQTLGNKPYTYHGNEFIFNAEATKKHAPFFHALHNDSLSHLRYDNPTVSKIFSEVPGMDISRVNKTARMVNLYNYGGMNQGVEKRLASIEWEMKKYFGAQSNKPEVENLPDGTRIIRTRNRTRIIKP